MKRRLRQVIALTPLLTCLAVTCLSTAADRIKRTVPLSAATWTVDLATYGSPSEGERYLNLRLWTFHSAALFLSENEVVATFVTIEPVEGLQRRDDPHRQLPFRLHAVVLDAASGRFLRQSTWDSDYRRIGLVPREDGTFAVFLGDRVDFYAADLAPRGELNLTKASEGIDAISVSVSPSERTTLVQYGKDPRVDCVWLNNEAVWDGPRVCPPVGVAATARGPIGAAISDEEVAAVTGHSWESASVNIKRGSEPSRKLCACHECYLPQFADERTLLILEPGSARLVRDDGKIVWRGGDGSAWGLHLYCYAPRPRLLAVPFGTGEGANYLGADVYDISARRRILRVNNYGNGEWLQGLAVSPNGKRLVIQSSGIVRCYDLPAAP